MKGENSTDKLWRNLLDSVNQNLIFEIFQHQYAQILNLLIDRQLIRADPQQLEKINHSKKDFTVYLWTVFQG